MAETRTIFTRANLFDGEGPGRPGAHVVVEGRHITQVGDGPAPAARPGDRVVDLEGRTLMPGMCQSHFHSCFGVFGGSISSPILGLEASAPFLTIVATRNLRTVLDHGFTSVVGSSNGDYIDVALKEAVGQGIIEGPRIYACTREFMTTGEQADGENRTWFMQIGNKGLTRKLDGPEAWRAATREDLGRGCDIVKISAGPGHGSAPARDYAYLTDDELRACVDTAHERGKKVRAHCPTRTAILQCARAGVDVIDHADRMDDECIEAILAADSFVLPSMLWSVRFLEMAENWDHSAGPFPIGEGFSESTDQVLDRLRLIRADFEHTCRMLPRAIEAGVKLVIGDDFGTPIMPHGEEIAEFEFYVKTLGIPTLEVLRWATRGGAELMGALDRRGTIAEGKLADLLVVDGDPLTDITCLRDPANLHAILIDGRMLKDALPA